MYLLSCTKDFAQGIVRFFSLFQLEKTPLFTNNVIHLENSNFWKKLDIKNCNSEPFLFL